MLKILLGGSPCTYWSIAQKNNRETKPTGLGWELFENYLIAKEKFKPDIFLYENNKSASKTIKNEIKKCFNVWDGSILMEDTGVRYIEINSALVSAQSRKRFYVHNCGEVKQPEDRGILLRDILETTENENGYPLVNVINKSKEDKEKSRTLMAGYYKYGTATLLTNKGLKGGATAIVENVDKRKIEHLGSLYGTNGLSPTISVACEMGGGHTPMVTEPICVNSKSGRVIKGELVENKQPSLEDRIYSIDGKSTAVTTCFHPNIAEPIRVGDVGSKSQGYRVYSCDGKSVTLSANGGGAGAKTGLYTCPINYLNESNVETLMRDFGAKGKILNESTDKTPTLLAAAGMGGGNAVYIAENIDKSNDANLIFTNEDGTNIPVYKVKNGLITIRGKEYPIKLADGYYIIRKLTVKECCRLQTLPDNYCRAVSKSQAYKGLGNGWTAEVIIHILNNALKYVPKDEEIVVLSMYDGIGTGRYCLDKMGFTNVRYYAYEIDKYAMQMALSNYPDIIQCGNAFSVREENWEKEFAGLNF